MKRRSKKIISHLPGFLAEYFEWLLCDASENQIRISKANKNKFRSYTQLKKHQKRLKLFGVGLVLVVFPLFVGLILGPDLFPKQIQSELYIPNGKGDVMLANISKNQVTVIFKTLDSANDNKPLATKGFVEVFADDSYTKFVKKTDMDDYAVTHVIPVDGLQEANIYYFRITAEDASQPKNVEMVSSWGDGKDPLRVYTTGEVVPACVQRVSDVIVAVTDDEKKVPDAQEEIIAPLAESSQEDKNTVNLGNITKVNNSNLKITDVMNENHLQPKNKVQTIISWITNKPSTTVLVYGEGRSNEKKEILVSEEMKTRHAVVMTTLTAGKTYYFTAKSVSEDGLVASSEEYSLRTPRPQSTIIDKIGESFKSLFTQPKL